MNNIRKERHDMFKAVYSALRPYLGEILNEEQRIILHLFLAENMDLMEIVEHMRFADYHIVKDELQTI